MNKNKQKTTTKTFFEKIDANLSTSNTSIMTPLGDVPADEGPAPSLTRSARAQKSNAQSNNLSNACLVGSSAAESRKYLVRVTAKDQAGNTAVGECSIFVGSQDSDGDHMFSLHRLSSCTVRPLASGILDKKLR